MGSHLGTGSNPEWAIKGPMGRCKATTPSSLSLTSNRVTTNWTAQLITGVCAHYRRGQYQLALNVYVKPN